ncbi:LptF/LptG family permease [Halosquirtibacter laminarini]|uniref:LptF/LptG family permease n=1 Tax=Halosquirtibacter laminarini TaxID=3374600 RepID=A0AC61NPL1_9BACT|nr:LptF/LptG family permease [Prolixibacteraceae bacterium]
MQKIDFYIIRKFLGTFFLSITLILSISIVFDVSEHMNDFIENDAPLKAIIFDFYLNWIPYFANLFIGLFTFISVIFFTSKMASNSEIIGILAGGVTYKRLMRPYLVSALLIACMSWILGNFIIPHSNIKMLDFKNTYIKGKFYNTETNIHKQVSPGVYMYMSRYNVNTDTGHRFSLEKIEDNRIVSKLISQYIRWDKKKDKWTIHDYYIRDFDKNGHETLTFGRKIDTTLTILPKEFKTRVNEAEKMNLFELNDYIKSQRLRGVSNMEEYEIMKHERTSGPFSTFILAIIGVSLASRKTRGGIGLNIALGLLLSFSYIMFMQVTKVFAISGGTDPFIAVWIPNIVYSIIALVLYRWASK